MQQHGRRRRRLRGSVMQRRRVHCWQQRVMHVGGREGAGRLCRRERPHAAAAGRPPHMQRARRIQRRNQLPSAAAACAASAIADASAATASAAATTAAAAAAATADECCGDDGRSMSPVRRDAPAAL
eukprot:25599-Chlamydomonas_euryale.AAC.2